MNRLRLANLHLFLMTATLLLGGRLPLEAQAVPQAAAANPEIDVIPFTYDPPVNPVPVIYVRINGGEILPFLLDTGTTMPMLLDLWAAKKLKLSPNGRHWSAKKMGKKGDMTTLRAVDFVASLPHAAKPAFVPIDLTTAGIGDIGASLAWASREHIAGVIGIVSFAPTTMCFDFVARTMTLSPDANDPVRPPGAGILPIKQVDGKCFVRLTDAEGGTLDALIDTGNDGVTLPMSTTARFHPALSPPVFRRAAMADGVHVSRLFLLPSLKVGETTEADVVVDAHVQSPDLSSLGMEFLRRFRMTLDFRHSEMILEHASNYAGQGHVPGLTGITLNLSAGEFHVSEVLPLSVAAKAGIKVGDTILRVDDQPLKSLPAAAAHHCLEGWADTWVVLLVKRSNAPPMKIKFQRQSIFSLPNGKAEDSK